MQPNVVLILTDDQGWGDLGLHGNTIIDTPHLDALGKRSVRFDTFYVHPVCSATRAALLTGRHFMRTGVAHVHGGRDFMHPGEITLAQWFRNEGYATGMWGKWHSGRTTGYLPWERGFDEAWMARLYEHHNGGGQLNGCERETPGWTTEVITDMALDFIERNRHRPFFAFVPHLAPHLPLVAREELIEKYSQRGLGETMATAFAMVEMVDTSVGRLLAGLKEYGLAENTLVCFLSDNGPQYFGTADCSPEDYAARYPAPLKGHKGSLWENGIKVPCFLSLPTRFQPRVVQRQANVQDLLPTFAQICGLKPPAGALPLDGRSLLPCLNGDDTRPPSETFLFSNPGWPPIKGPHHPWPDWERIEYMPVTPREKSNLQFGPQLMGIRTDTHKLIRNPGFAEGMPERINGEVLVDMDSDPFENTNIADAEPAVTHECRIRLSDWFDEIRNEPHAFHTPRFAIGPDTTNVVYLYAPTVRHGDAWNGGLDSRNWVSAGDGGSYAICASEGLYNVTIETSGTLGDPVPLTLAIEDRPILQSQVDAPCTELGHIQLPAGNTSLRVTRSSRSGGSIDRLVSLHFTPIANTVNKPR